MPKGRCKDVAVAALVGLLLGSVALPSSADEAPMRQLVDAQATLLDGYRQSMESLEKGPLRLFQLLVSFANQELDTAELVKRRIYSDARPEALRIELEDFQVQQSTALDVAASELNRDALARFKERQRLALMKFRDQRLMEHIRSEVTRRDQESQALLEEIITLVAPDARTVKRVKRKQRKIDTAMRSLANAFERYDISDHRLSTRVDRIKDFRLERISLVLTMLAKPASGSLDNSAELAAELDRSHAQLERDTRRALQ